MRFGMCLGMGGVALAASMGASVAQAAPVTFDLQTALVDFNQSEPGLRVDGTVLPSGFPAAFSLDEGESYTFDLFTIRADEPFDPADLGVESPLTVTLSFANLQNVAVQGVSYAQGPGAGVADFEPLTVVDGDLVYTVTLSDAAFSIDQQVYYRLAGVPTVTATISRAATAIPTPAAAGAGLVLLAGAVARRRRD